ncbi:FG-GAP repeat domain-containing protein [Candidatus Frankia alpina]|uniref:VCBS repeat-containing protein n=1 Tax=Candidatus Frankia alpina TaxID=2699483 RepID=A0A4S5ER42_9ACTN|nr:VCBS repeat-containing protein [Candidatus Frankia alpina]THJ74623.1 VCBS repeat-containing protein [Candidatus Frankia alpina]
MSALEPDELTRLLTEAVEPIRPSPEAYRQIRAGIARRRRWRIPAFALGGMVMAALIGLAVVAIRPSPSSPSSQVVEPAAPPVMPSTFSEPSRAATVPSLGGGTGHSSSGGRGGSASGSTTRVPTSPPPTRPTASPQSVAPTSPQSSAPSNSTGPGSPQLPTPVAKPPGVNDIDGDGQPDTVAVDGTNNLRVRFSRDGQVARVALGSIITPLNSAVVDIDGDGFGELLVQTQAASGMKSYALLRYVSLDELAALTPPGDLTLGAGVRGNSALGFRCADKTLQISTGTSSDGTQFTVSTTTLGLTPDGLTVQDTAFSTVRLPADSSPFVVSCGALS